MDRARLAARIFVALTAVVVLFQLALAAGAPWGAVTMGGANPGVLPPPMRVAAVVQALLLVGFAIVVASRAGLGFAGFQGVSRKLVWVVVAYGAIGSVMNAITPSFWERVIWLPIVITIFVTALVVARSRDGARVG